MSVNKQHTPLTATLGEAMWAKLLKKPENTPKPAVQETVAVVNVQRKKVPLKGPVKAKPR